MLDRDRTPLHWKRKIKPCDTIAGRTTAIKIALVVNMPDPALEDTESQFFELLDAASQDIPVYLTLFSLPGLPRGDRANQHLRQFYCGIEELWNGGFDAAIITGTEPRYSDLRVEPYWNMLVDILDWAERDTFSTVLSCLAAHAGVLHNDGIERQGLSDKRFGVFSFRIGVEHFLTAGFGEMLHTPHSRWNEISEEALASAGYTILAWSAEAGADWFIKTKRKSLILYFQGHPEYHTETLLKEYRRDIKRFLRQERETYPTLPQGYFDATSTKLLAAFQQKASSRPGPEVLADFPESAVAARLRNRWSESATRIYRNWLQYVAARKTGIEEFVPGVHLGVR